MIMKGVSAYGDLEACVRGIKAGLNMFIYRNSTPETISVIEKIAALALDDEELRNCIENSYSLITNLKNKTLL